MRRPMGTFRLITTCTVLGLLSRPLAAQQTTLPADARVDSVEPTSSFHDDFKGPALDTSRWQATLGVSIVRNPVDRSCMTLRLMQSCTGTKRGATVLTSADIDLEDVSGAEVTYSVRPHDVDVGESLLVEYRTRDDTWTLLERVVANPGSGAKFSERRHILPADALHAKFRLRLSAELNDPDDAWYLRSVSILRRKPECELAVHSHPREGVLCTIASGDPTQIRQEATPGRRTYPCGTGAVIAAPAAQDGWVFDAWTTEGQSGSLRQRVLALELSRDTNLTARYRPWGGSRSVARVTVVSLPDAGVPVDVCIDQVYLPAENTTDADLEVLTGEFLQLTVPSRTLHWVFETWLVDGTAVYAPSPTLELRVTGDTVVLAEYALLGDMNADGRLDKFDVDAFVTALIDPEGYALQFPGVNRVRRGDVSGDGVLDALDVEQFVDLMVEE